MEKGKVNQKEVITRTGNLMLKGWKLLGMACPICHTALLSKDNQMRCPGCDMPVRKEGEIGSTASTETKTEPKLNQPSNSVPMEEEEEPVDVPTSYEDLRREYDQKNKKSSQVSSKLGEKMLLGWTMLADSCPDFDQCGGTPLMKDPATNNVHCVCCGQKYIYTPNGELLRKGEVVPKAEKVPEVQQQKLSLKDFQLDEFDNEENEPPRIVNFQQKKEDDSSWKISQKLLLGWSLLDACCRTSKCNGRTPLLKDHEGKRYCVECGYIDEPKKEVIKEPVVVAAVSRKKTVQELIDEEDNEEEVQQKVQSLFTSSLIQPKNITVRSNLVSNSNVGEVKDDVVQVLTKKLRMTASELENSNSIECSMQYALLITRLAESLKAVQSL